MLTCINCHFSTELDDIEVHTAGGCICLRCFAREAGRRAMMSLLDAIQLMVALLVRGVVRVLPDATVVHGLPILLQHGLWKHWRGVARSCSCRLPATERLLVTGPMETAVDISGRSGSETGCAEQNDAAAVVNSAPRVQSAARRNGHLMTRREVEILDLIAAGCSNREIADTLVLSVRTVERHITNVYTKIGARNRADATCYALSAHAHAPELSCPGRA